MGASRHSGLNGSDDLRSETLDADVKKMTTAHSKTKMTENDCRESKDGTPKTATRGRRC